MTDQAASASTPCGARPAPSTPGCWRQPLRDVESQLAERDVQGSGDGRDHLAGRLLEPALHLGEVLRRHPRPFRDVAQRLTAVVPVGAQPLAEHGSPQGLSRRRLRVRDHGEFGHARIVNPRSAARSPVSALSRGMAAVLVRRSAERLPLAAEPAGYPALAERALLAGQLDRRTLELAGRLLPAAGRSRRPCPPRRRRPRGSRCRARRTRLPVSLPRMASMMRCGHDGALRSANDAGLRRPHAGHVTHRIDARVRGLQGERVHRHPAVDRMPDAMTTSGAR